MDEPAHRTDDTQALFAIVYDELRHLARFWWRDQTPGQTLQPTALVHEAYMKLAHSETPVRDQEHFRAVAAKAMRHALIEHLRSRMSLKRGSGHRAGRTLTGIESDGELDPATVLALDESINTLEALDERKARVVEMRYFAGMNDQEIARVLGVSDRTVRSEWRAARAWLSNQLDGSDGHGH
jgi:RNA polymerase sigma factor (TIGR02999 family)